MFRLNYDFYSHQFLVLVVVLFFCLTSIPQVVMAAPCSVCGAGYSMPSSMHSHTITSGRQTVTCGGLSGVAAQRDHGTDVCSLVMTYARDHCGCVDASGNPAPTMPYYSSTVNCPVCSGAAGSDFWVINPAMADDNIDTGVSGFQAKCSFLQEIGWDTEGFFTAGECTTVQASVLSNCGCGNYL